MTFTVQQQVFGLKVAVDDITLVEVVERRYDLRSVKVSHGACKAASVAQVEEKLATTYVLEQHVEKACVVLRPHPAGNTARNAMQYTH